MCCPSSYSYSTGLHRFTHPTWDSDVGVLGIMWVELMSLLHGWGLQPPQTASSIRIWHIKHVWANWHPVHRHKVAALQSYTHPTWLTFLGSLGSELLVESKMKSLCHGWGCQLTSNCFLYPTRHVQSVWSHWCAVYRHRVAVLDRFTLLS